MQPDEGLGMHLVASGNREEFVKDVHAVHFCLCASCISPDSRNWAAQSRKRGVLVLRRRAACTLPSETHGINAHFPSTCPALLEAVGLAVGLRKVFCKRHVSLPVESELLLAKVGRCLCRAHELEHPQGALLPRSGHVRTRPAPHGSPRHLEHCQRLERGEIVPVIGHSLGPGGSIYGGAWRK